MSQKIVAAGEFVEQLRLLRSQLVTKELIVEFLSDRTIKSSTLDRFTTYNDERYTRNLIYRDDLFEVIMLCWQPGQGTPVHTHNGQLGWMVMDRGALEVQNYSWLGCNKPENQNVVGIDCLGGATEIHVKPTELSTCHPGGGVATVDKIQTIHSIGSPHENKERARSIHIYSLPFDSCISFDLSRGSCARRELKYDTIGGEPASTVPAGSWGGGAR